MLTSSRADNNFAFYHEGDSIFNLDDEVPREECDLTSTECNNCCKGSPKLRNW